MGKTIRQILLKEKENLEDEILSCLSNLNILQNFTYEELDMSNEKVEIESKREAANIDSYGLTKQKIEHWLKLMNDGMMRCIKNRFLMTFRGFRSNTID